MITCKQFIFIERSYQHWNFTNFSLENDDSAIITETLARGMLRRVAPIWAVAIATLLMSIYLVSTAVHSPLSAKWIVVIACCAITTLLLAVLSLTAARAVLFPGPKHRIVIASHNKALIAYSESIPEQTDSGSVLSASKRPGSLTAVRQNLSQSNRAIQGVSDHPNEPDTLDLYFSDGSVTRVVDQMAKESMLLLLCDDDVK